MIGEHAFQFCDRGRRLADGFLIKIHAVRPKPFDRMAARAAAGVCIDGDRVGRHVVAEGREGSFSNAVGHAD